MSKLHAPEERFPVARSSSTPRNDLDPPAYSNPVLNVVGADRGPRRAASRYLSICNHFALD